MKWLFARVLLVALLLTVYGSASSLLGEGCNMYSCGDSGDQCTTGGGGNNDNCFGFGSFCVAWGDCA